MLLGAKQFSDLLSHSTLMKGQDVTHTLTQPSIV